jgi:hypothetical protein
MERLFHQNSYASPARKNIKIIAAPIENRLKQTKTGNTPAPFGTVPGFACGCGSTKRSPGFLSQDFCGYYHMSAKLSSGFCRLKNVLADLYIDKWQTYAKIVQIFGKWQIHTDIFYMLYKSHKSLHLSCRNKYCAKGAGYTFDCHRERNIG